MKHRKMKYAVMALICMLLSSSTTVSAQKFFSDDTDSPGWAWFHISWARENNIVAGKGNNCFDGNSHVTRAEAAAMILGLKEIDAEAYDVACESFEDVGEQWYTKYINAAYANDLIAGKTETTFDPEGKLTRAEAATMIVNAMGYELESDEERIFVDSMGEWYTKYINTAYAHLIVGGKTENQFDPNAYVTRAELVVMLHATVRENSAVGEINMVAINMPLEEFVLTDAEGRTLSCGVYNQFEDMEDVFVGELAESGKISTFFGYGDAHIWLEDMGGSDSFTFDPVSTEELAIGFRGRYNSIVIRGNNIDKVCVDADAKIYLYGTDMTYTIVQKNDVDWDKYLYEGSSSGDVVLQIIDKQLVDITE